MANIFFVIVGLVCLFTPVKISAKRTLPKEKSKILGISWIVAGGLGYISGLFVLPDAGLLGNLAIVLYGVAIILTLYFVISTKEPNQLITNEISKTDKQQKIVNYVTFIFIIGCIVALYYFLN
jgi:NADH:ubiquinone oxidoreductase subunit 6 (subunit J)